MRHYKWNNPPKKNQKLSKKKKTETFQMGQREYKRMDTYLKNTTCTIHLLNKLNDAISNESNNKMRNNITWPPNGSIKSG